MKIDEVLLPLIGADTRKIIADLADFIIVNPVSIESFPQALGIIVLAVDDAKTRSQPASQNPLYLDVFHRTKALL